MRKIFILLIIVVTIMSCKTKKKVSHDYEKEDKSEIITSDKTDSISKSIETDIIVNEELETVEKITTKIDYQVVTDSVSGTKKSIPKTKTVTSQKASKGTKSIEDKSTKTVNKNTTEKDTSTKKDIDIKDEKDTKKTFNNTAIVKFGYLIIAILLGGYIIVKKYFPSIFVKVKKLLTL